MTKSSTAGAVISVVGPDGAGKTTLIDSLTEGILRSKRVLMIRNVGILPRRHTPGEAVFAPHKDPPYPLPVSLAKTVYLFADYLLGWIFKVRPYVKRGGWIVIQRGWWDLAVDPLRYRLSKLGKLLAWLGHLLPHPQMLLVLEAPAEVVYARKTELSLEELRRQTRAWHELIPKRQHRIYIDASNEASVVVEAAEQGLRDLIDSGRTSRPPATQWVGLPDPRRPRFLLPTGARSVAKAGLRIYQPVTTRGLIGWKAAQLAAAAGAFRALPSKARPPEWAIEKIRGHVPEGGTVAFARTNHPTRFVAVIIGSSGSIVAAAKLAEDPRQKHLLDKEAKNLSSIATRLPYPLTAPRIVHAEDGLLLLEPVDWRPRLLPWRLSQATAFALGRFYRGDQESGPESGDSHGDFAPWNLFANGASSVLIDWEEAGEAPAFFDLFHFLTQGHALLRRPTTRSLLEGLDERGWVASVIHSYCEGARLPQDEAPKAFVRYLEDSLGRQRAHTSDGRRGIVARDRLLSILR